MGDGLDIVRDMEFAVWFLAKWLQDPTAWTQIVVTGSAAVASTAVAVAALVVSRRSFELSRAAEVARTQETRRAKADSYEAALNQALAQFVVETRAYLDASATSIMTARFGTPTPSVTSHLLFGASERLTFVASGADLAVIYEIQLALRAFVTPGGRGPRVPYEELGHLIDVLQRWRTDPDCDAAQAVTLIKKIVTSGGTERPS